MQGGALEVPHSQEDWGLVETLQGEVHRGRRGLIRLADVRKALHAPAGEKLSEGRGIPDEGGEDDPEPLADECAGEDGPAGEGGGGGHDDGG